MKAREVVTRTIGGFEVSTTKLRPLDALKLAPKVMKVIVPALPVVIGGGKLLLEDVDAAAAALTKLLEVLDAQAIDTLCRELLCETSIVLPNEHGVMAVFELNTADMVNLAFGSLDNGMTLLVQTMLFVGEVNFKRSFFDLLAAAGLKRKAPAKTEAAPA